jgi:hypothetical protein
MQARERGSKLHYLFGCQPLCCQYVAGREAGGCLARGWHRLDPLLHDSVHQRTRICVRKAIAREIELRFLFSDSLHVEYFRELFLCCATCITP